MSKVFQHLGPFHKMRQPDRNRNDFQISINLKIRLAIADWIARKGYCAPDCDIHSLSRDIGISEDHLVCFFQEKYKGGFRKLRKDLRIELAKKLLLSMPDVPLSHIGVHVGITDKSNFRKQFTEATGMSPDKWRHLHKK